MPYNTRFAYASEKKQYIFVKIKGLSSSRLRGCFLEFGSNNCLRTIGDIVLINSNYFAALIDDIGRYLLCI